MTDWRMGMKVFLIIAGIIFVSEVLDFILKLVDSILGKKKLRLENRILKNELEKANETITNNLGEFAKIIELSERGKEIEDLKSRNADLLMENMQLKSLVGAYRNTFGSGFHNTNSKPEISKDTVSAVRYAMKHAHPDNGGNAEDFIRFQKCYDELTRNGG